MASTTQKVLVEVRDVEELLTKAADASSHAAMWFCDIADLERYGVNEQYTVGDAARLLGIATAAKWDADCAVQRPSARSRCSSSSTRWRRATPIS